MKPFLWKILDYNYMTAFLLYELCLTSCVNFLFFNAFISHTKGHISYYVTGKEEENPAVFTGDTLVSSVLSVK